jgi:hypothetical protein
VSLRQLALWVAFWLLVLFYAPVVALIQAPVNMDNLMKVRCDVMSCCCHRPTLGNPFFSD